jgi:hypothetical protein
MPLLLVLRDVPGRIMSLQSDSLRCGTLMTAIMNCRIERRRSFDPVYGERSCSRVWVYLPDDFYDETAVSAVNLAHAAHNSGFKLSLQTSDLRRPVVHVLRHLVREQPSHPPLFYRRRQDPNPLIVAHCRRLTHSDVLMRRQGVGATAPDRARATLTRRRKPCTPECTWEACSPR